MIKGDRHIDEVIFDYIEGNLSQEEKEQLELQMLQDENLKDQIEAWKMTTLDIPLISTEELEINLLKNDKGKWWQFSLNSFFGIGFLLLFLPNSLMEKNISTRGHMVIEKVSDTVETDEKVRPLSSPVINNVRNKTIPKATSPSKAFVQKEVFEASKEELLKTATLPAIESREPFRQTVIFLNYGKPLKLKKAVVKKQLSAKMKREMNRKVRRDMERKLANKFRRGNVPYVVPLDISNF